MKIQSEMNLKEILLQMLNHVQSIDTSSRTWLTPDQLARYTGLSVHTIYQYVSNRKIPFHKIPGSSKLLFHKDEIDLWIQGDVDVKDDRIHAKKVVDEIWEKI